MRSKVFIIILILIFSFRIWQTTGCRHFSGFQFNPLSIKINVESQTNTDLGLNRNISRFFHNKVSTGLFELTKSYASIYQPRFLLEVLGPLGLILVLFGLLNIFRKKKALGFTHLTFILFTSLITIFRPGPKISFYILASSWYSFSFWGISHFTKSLLLRTLFIFLAFLTLWYFIFSWQMSRVCNQIFFN